MCQLDAAAPGWFVVRCRAGLHEQRHVHHLRRRRDVFGKPELALRAGRRTVQLGRRELRRWASSTDGHRLRRRPRLRRRQLSAVPGQRRLRVEPGGPLSKRPHHLRHHARLHRRNQRARRHHLRHQSGLQSDGNLRRVHHRCVVHHQPRQRVSARRHRVPERCSGLRRRRAEASRHVVRHQPGLHGDRKLRGLRRRRLVHHQCRVGLPSGRPLVCNGSSGLRRRCAQSSRNELRRGTGV